MQHFQQMKIVNSSGLILAINWNQKNPHLTLEDFLFLNEQEFL